MAVSSPSMSGTAWTCRAWCRRRKLMASGSTRGEVAFERVIKLNNDPVGMIGCGWIIRSNKSGCAPTRSSRSRSFSSRCFWRSSLPSVAARDLRSLLALARVTREGRRARRFLVAGDQAKQRRDRRVGGRLQPDADQNPARRRSVARAARNDSRQVAENIREVFWDDQRHQERNDLHQLRLRGNLGAAGRRSVCRAAFVAGGRSITRIATG